MRITKLKYDGERIHLEYEKSSMKEGEWDNYVIDSTEQPKISLLRCLQGLRSYVADMCEWPQEDVQKIRVIGVTVHYKGSDAVMNVVVTATRRVRLSPATITVNTPNLPVKIAGDAEAVLPEVATNFVRQLIQEAEDYINGARLQVPMPMEKSSEN